MNLDALRDTLTFCAEAVGQASLGRMAAAIIEWDCALDCLPKACPEDSEAGAALKILVEASGPSFAADPDRADLRRVLLGVAIAVMPALDGDTETAGDALLEASGLAASLTGWGEHFATVLAAAWEEAAAQGGVSA